MKHAQHSGEWDVLVVEDDERLLELITLVLTGSERYRVRQARSVKEGRSEIADSVPDAIVLDVVLPDGSGLELCAEVKSNDRTHITKVMVLTALAQESVRQASHRQGADAYLTKPFSPRRLLAEVDALTSDRGDS